MGRGRKKYTLKDKYQPHTQKGKYQPSWTVNCNVTARNIRKGDLGGVIFGCTNSTIKECYSKQLFGLPAPHISYVRNIYPGLTLFLFNYSNRKLHGIFEALSPGQMNINPHGWTIDGSELTPYAAQVRIRIRTQCQPLLEDQFKPIIAENYYELKHFWFELDRAQTSKLIDLFSSSPVIASSSFSQNTRQEGENIETPALEAEFTSNESNMEWGSSWDASAWGRESQLLQAPIDEEAKKYQQEDMHLKPNCERSYTSVVSNVSTSLPQKKWVSLFRTSSVSDIRKENEGINTPPSEMDFPHTDQSNMELELSCNAPCLDGEIQLWEASTDEEAPCVTPHLDGEESQALEAPADEDATEMYKKELARRKGESQALEAPADEDATEMYKEELAQWKGESQTLEAPMHEEELARWKGESQALEAPADEDTTEIHAEEIARWRQNCECSCLSSGMKDSEENLEEDVGVHSEDNCSSEGKRDLETKSSGLQSVVAKLMLEVEELKACQFKQIKKVSSLEQELVESKEEIQQLKDRCMMLESGSSPSIAHAGNTEFELINEPHSDLSESIFIVGGFNGSSWLSDLDSYSPSWDLMKSLSPMSFVRLYGSAAKLNGELYILGGVDGDNVWYDTVESYNPLSNQWVSRPSLNQRKGSVAGASLNDKIFAIGGANGVECLSDVEMLDLDVGRWIPTRSMVHKRFAPAAAEINGIIYVVGGYDGQDYLKSVERLDPREHSWTRLQNMSSSRGCHSLAVLNEKLYALGGYDGAKMVPTVEVFDPRIGSWMIGESMSHSRGYSAAVVLGHSIYVIGGLKESAKDGVRNDEEILDTVECYKEGRGWQVTNLKAVGKRCFFSAIVL